MIFPPTDFFGLLTPLKRFRKLFIDRNGVFKDERITMSDKFENELKGLKKDLEKYDKTDLNKNIDELKNTVNKLENMDINLKAPLDKKDTEEKEAKNSKGETGKDTPPVSDTNYSTQENSKKPPETNSGKQENKSKEKQTTAVQKPTETVPIESGVSKDKIDSLQESVSHLDKAIKNMVSIFNNAISELQNDNSEQEMSDKLDRIIKQNEKILSKLEASGEIPAAEKKGGSPFPPKPPAGLDSMKQNPAPKPPEDDHIPRLQPRKGKKYDL